VQQKNKKMGTGMTSWQVKRLGEVAEVVSGGTPDTRVEEFWNGNIQWITPSEITKVGKRISKPTEKQITEKGLRASSAVLIPANSIILCSRATIGECAINDYEITTNQGFKNLIIKDGAITEFVYYWVKLNKKALLRISSGSTFLEFSKNDLEKLEINLPPVGEQGRIVGVLEVWDEYIEGLKRKVALKEELKKGLMQQIFGQKLRVGKNTTEWQKVKLGDLCKKAKSGGTPTATKEIYYDGGDIPFLAISDMTEQGKYLSRTSKFITQLGLENSSAWIVPKKSLIYSMYASVGLPSINNIEMATSQAMMNILPNEKVNLEFLYYYLLDFRKYIYRYVETGTQGNINADIVKNLPILLPSLKEQEKIAEILANCDEEIELLKNKLSAIQQQKKFLLRNLITGEIRTPEDILTKKES